MEGGCGLYPPLGNNLPAAELSALLIAEGELCKILGADHKTPAAGFNTSRAGFPVRLNNAERLKKARSKVFNDAHLCHLVDNAAKQIHIFTDIKEFSTRLADPLAVNNIMEPAILCLVHKRSDRKAAAHGKKILNGHFFKICVGFIAPCLRKNFNKLCVKLKISLVNCKADSR